MATAGSVALAIEVGGRLGTAPHRMRGSTRLRTDSFAVAARLLPDNPAPAN